MSGKFSLGHTSAARLTPDRVIEMRRLYAEQGWTQGALARHFQISVGQVGRIVRGESWQRYVRIPHERELEDRMVAEGQVPLSDLEVSLLAMKERLAAEPTPPRHEPDPLEEVIRRRGGADPLARRPPETSQPSEAGGETPKENQSATEIGRDTGTAGLPDTGDADGGKA